MEYLITLTIITIIMVILMLLFNYLKRKALIENNMYIAALGLGFIVVYYSVLNQVIDTLLTYCGFPTEHHFISSMIPGLYIVLICTIYYFAPSKSIDTETNKSVIGVQNNIGRDQYNISGNLNKGDD